VKPLGALFLVVAAVSSVQAGERDQLCSKLQSFEAATEKLPNRQADWITVRWDVSDDAIFSIACTHRNSEGSREFCSWVPSNVSMEFAGLLPQRILKCYSIDPKRYGVDQFPSDQLSFKTARRNKFVLQTGHYPDENGQAWMRLALFPKGSKQTVKDLPHLEPYEDEAAE
jgi:hypothetical protein